MLRLDGAGVAGCPIGKEKREGSSDLLFDQFSGREERP